MIFKTGLTVFFRPTAKQKLRNFKFVYVWKCDTFDSRKYFKIVFNRCRPFGWFFTHASIRLTTYNFFNVSKNRRFKTFFFF